jgi:hypothetical protein
LNERDNKESLKCKKERERERERERGTERQGSEKTDRSIDEESRGSEHGRDVDFSTDIFCNGLLPLIRTGAKTPLAACLSESKH